MSGEGHAHLSPSPAEGATVISLAERMRARRESAPAAPARSLPAPQTPTHRGVRARVAAVTDTCWCCRQKVRAVVGAIVDPALTADGSGFLALEQIDEALLRQLDPRTLVRRGIGELRHRESPGVEGGYVANGCPHCDALIGRFRIEDLLTDHRMAGGSFGQLDSGIIVELEAEPVERRAPLVVHG